EVREASGAKIQLARDEMDGLRPCHISGPFQNAMQALSMIFETTEPGAAVETTRQLAANETAPGPSRDGAEPGRGAAGRGGGLALTDCAALFSQGARGSGNGLGREAGHVVRLRLPTSERGRQDISRHLGPRVQEVRGLHWRRTHM
ncbi:unnamed protein product, partial [Prorocentrum cordatum]